MKKDEKAKVINDLGQSLQNAQTALLVDYRGLKVEELRELRRQLRAVSATMKIVKNTLAKRTVDQTRFMSLQPEFKGPTALIYSDDQCLDFIKIITKFQDTHPIMNYRSGVFDGVLFTAESVPDLIALPPKEQLLAKIIGSLQSPVRTMIAALQAPVSNIVSILKQISERDSSKDESA